MAEETTRRVIKRLKAEEQSINGFKIRQLPVRRFARPGVDQKRPFTKRDDSWRDRSERKVKGWDRGKHKQKVMSRRGYKDSLLWEEHKALLEKVGMTLKEYKLGNLDGRR